MRGAHAALCTQKGGGGGEAGSPLGRRKPRGLAGPGGVEGQGLAARACPSAPGSMAGAAGGAPGTDIGHLLGDGGGLRPGGTSGCGCLGLGGAHGQGRQGGEELETGTAMAWLRQELTLLSSPQEYFPGEVFPLWSTTVSQWCSALAELWECCLVKHDKPMLSPHHPCLLAGLERASRRLWAFRRGSTAQDLGFATS